MNRQWQSATGKCTSDDHQFPFCKFEQRTHPNHKQGRFSAAISKHRVRAPSPWKKKSSPNTVFLPHTMTLISSAQFAYTHLKDFNLPSLLMKVPLSLAFLLPLVEHTEGPMENYNRAHWTSLYPSCCILALAF